MAAASLTTNTTDTATAPAWLAELTAAARQKRQNTGRPLVTLSYAQSLDGCLTDQRGRPLALSGENTLRLTHALRAAHSAILIGVGTLLADNPSLTVRHVAGSDPQPVVLDSQLRTPPDAGLLGSGHRTPWLATTAAAPQQAQQVLKAAGARLLLLPAQADGRVSLPALLDRLGEMEVDSLMVEGGAQVITAFLAQRLADWAAITISPHLLGGYHAVSAPLGDAQRKFPRLSAVEVQQIGPDVFIWGQLEY